MNKTLSTVLKILGAVAALAAIVGTVLYFLEKKGIITCCSGDCLNCKDYEDCDFCDASEEEEAAEEETAEEEASEEEAPAADAE